MPQVRYEHRPKTKVIQLCEVCHVIWKDFCEDCYNLLSAAAQFRFHIALQQGAASFGDTFWWYMGRLGMAPKIARFGIEHTSYAEVTATCAMCGCKLTEKDD